jgi:hypothetical protein
MGNSVQEARNTVVSLIYSKREGGMVDSVKLRAAIDALIAAVRAENSNQVSG